MVGKEIKYFNLLLIKIIKQKGKPTFFKWNFYMTYNLAELLIIRKLNSDLISGVLCPWVAHCNSSKTATEVLIYEWKKRRNVLSRFCELIIAN